MELPKYVQYCSEINSVEALLDRNLVSATNVAQQEFMEVLGHTQRSLDKFKNSIAVLPKSSISQAYVRGLFSPCMKLSAAPFKVASGGDLRDDLRSAVFSLGISILLRTHPDLVPPVSEAELISSYSKMNDQSPTERMILAAHMRFSRLELYLLRPEKNKKYFLSACTKLAEGTNVHYITGSGQKADTQRRVDIYERETGVLPLPRPPRMKREREDEVTPLIRYSSLSSIGSASSAMSGLSNSLERFNSLTSVVSSSADYPSSQASAISEDEVVQLLMQMGKGEVKKKEAAPARQQEVKKQEVMKEEDKPIVLPSLHSFPIAAATAPLYPPPSPVPIPATVQQQLQQQQQVFLEGKRQIKPNSHYDLPVRLGNRETKLSNQSFSTKGKVC